MPVLLDSTPLWLPEPTLATALSAAQSAAASRRRVITEILLDGRPLAEEALRTPSPASLDPGTELRFTTADPLQLVRSSWQEAAANLGRIRERQASAARAIQSGRFDQALPELAESFKAWETARQVLVDGCSLLGVDPEALEVDVDGSIVQVSGLVRLLVNRLSELKRALTAQDWCGIADVLGYDLSPDADIWRAALTAMSDNLGDQR